jgi:hypothetical protein
MKVDELRGVLRVLERGERDDVVDVAYWFEALAAHNKLNLRASRRIELGAAICRSEVDEKARPPLPWQRCTSRAWS